MTANPTHQPIEITVFTKTGGPLTKRILLDPDGKVISDGSACVMSHGRAERVIVSNLTEAARLIAGQRSNQAITLGMLRPDLPDNVKVTTKDKLNGSAQLGIIARTGDYIVYRPNQLALVLIDIDTKGMPAAVKAAINAIGGFRLALESMLPELAMAGRVVRKSTSTGISRTDTGASMPGSNGFHVYVLVKDGADIERFLRTLHARCWLLGFGWMMVGAGGQMLERSLIDRMVYAPERLVFEGAPILEPPLVQDQASRTPITTEGPPLDTRAVCPALSAVEQSKLGVLLAAARHHLAPEAAKVRAGYIVQQAGRIVHRTGCTMDAARHIVERQCGGVLLPDVVLPFDAPEFEGSTVADVLADPDRFIGATLSDPLEGPSYGVGKAKIMQRSDGTLWINSFAHGRAVYDLKHDARSVEAAIIATPKHRVADIFVEHVLAADLEADEEQRLRYLACDRSGTGRQPMGDKLKAARAGRASQRAKAERERRAAERTDPRPQIDAPPHDAPWLPQMDVLNGVLGGSADDEPPMRNIDGVVAQVRVRRVPNMHALTPNSSNGEATEETQLPPPDQPLLTRLNEDALAELIERHIEYIDGQGRPVHLGTAFVRHYLSRADDALPIVVAIATLPIVLGDGSLLAPRGLDRDRGIVFHVPEELLSLLPTRDQCDDAAVRKAFKFLHDEWLVDVATDFTGKCILIAAALTLIERSLLPDRPAFFVTAGRRGGGKTTTLIMLLMAITGVRPSAAAWSPNEEERRKALLAYLLEALCAIIWDNIPRGTQISCAHIERSCTTALYSDRRLGVSELVAVAAATIHFFTGNNIGPRSDLASRSLIARLETDRADPENRPFKHPDPVGWTEANRGKILVALYTILLGNPALRPGSNVAPKTRFKAWWRLVGSAVEHAASVADGTLDFQTLFLSQEEDDEEATSLSDALIALSTKWPGGADFQAADVARMINDRSDFSIDKERGAALRQFLFPELEHKADQTVTPKSVGKRLKKHVGEPVKVGTQTLCLKEQPKPPGKPDAAGTYIVRIS
jgi:hypothetical protein